MARHQPRNPISESRRAWLVVALFSALSGHGPDSTAENSVDVINENSRVPTVNRAPLLAASTAADIEEISVPDPSPSEPVTAVMTIQPKRASVGDTVEVLVHIRIAGAHFIHAKDDAAGPFIPVAVNTTLPAGVEANGEWQVPTPEKGRGNSRVFRNSVVLRRSLRVVSGPAPAALTVIGELRYQVCTDELCWPLRKLKLSAPLTIQPQRR